jgi:hypothetical protein
VSNYERKKLPNGVWLFLAGLPLGTTDEELSAHLKANYLDIGPECVDARDYRKCACAVVSVQDDVVYQLVTWALEGTQTTFNGVRFDVRMATDTARYKARKAV